MEKKLYTVQTIEFPGVLKDDGFYYRIGDPNFRIDSHDGSYRFTIVDGKSSMNEEEFKLFREGKYNHPNYNL